MIQFVTPSRRTESALFEGTDVVNDLYEYSRKFQPDI